VGPDLTEHSVQVIKRNRSDIGIGTT
jgi:hypothetical protein